MVKKSLIAVCFLIIAVLIAFYSYSEDNILTNIRLFTQILTQVENKYVEEVDKAKLVAAATEGLMRPLDPFCQILVAKEDGSFPSGDNGIFEGYGLAFSIENRMPIVAAPIYNSPLSERGICAGDMIVKINERIVRNMSLSEILDIMENPESDTLTFSINPVGERGTIVYEIHEEDKSFQEISVPYVLTKDDWGYISLRRLSNGVSEDFEDKLTQLIDKKALILDIRNCPNGNLEEAIQIADLFLPKGKVITQIGTKNSTEKVFEAQRPAVFSNKPLLILTNQGTFGFSEIIVSALREHGIGVVIGERTAGKTGIQEVLPINEQYALELTTKEYLTPKGNSLLIEYAPKEDEPDEKEVVNDPGVEPALKVGERKIPRFVRTLFAKEKIQEFVDNFSGDILEIGSDEVLKIFQQSLDEEEYDYNEKTFEKTEEEIYYFIKLEALRKKDTPDLMFYVLEKDPVYNKATELLSKADTNEKILEIIEQEKKAEEEKE